MCCGDLLEDEEADGDLQPKLPPAKTPMKTPRKQCKVTDGETQQMHKMDWLLLYEARWEHDLSI